MLVDLTPSLLAADITMGHSIGPQQSVSIHHFGVQILRSLLRGWIIGTVEFMLD
jgi:hypothetical protein